MIVLLVPLVGWALPLLTNSETVKALLEQVGQVATLVGGAGAWLASRLKRSHAFLGQLERASEAVVVGFHVRPDPSARKEAESQGVDIRLYRVIYEATDEIRAAMAGLLPPRIEEKELGRAEVRETFTIPKIGTIAGSYVVEGLIRRNAQARLVRDGVQIYSGKVGSLRRFKDDAREVQTGFECGIGIDGYNDIKVGDVIEVFELQEKPATLE